MVEEPVQLTWSTEYSTDRSPTLQPLPARGEAFTDSSPLLPVALTTGVDGGSGVDLKV